MVYTYIKVVANMNGSELNDGYYVADGRNTGDTSVLKKGDKFYIFEEGEGVISEPYDTINKAFNILFTEEDHSKGC